MNGARFEEIVLCIAFGVMLGIIVTIAALEPLVSLLWKL